MEAFNIFHNEIKDRLGETRTFIPAAEFYSALRSKEKDTTTLANELGAFIISVGESTVILNTVNPSTDDDPFETVSLAHGDNSRGNSPKIRIMEIIKSPVYKQLWSGRQLKRIANGLVNENGPELCVVFPPCPYIQPESIVPILPCADFKKRFNALPFITKHLELPESVTSTTTIVQFIFYLLLVHTFKGSYNELIKFVVLLRHFIGRPNGHTFAKKYTRLFGGQGSGKSSLINIISWFIYPCNISTDSPKQYTFDSSGMCPFQLFNEYKIDGNDDNTKKQTTDTNSKRIEKKNQQHFKLLTVTNLVASTDNILTANSLVVDKNTERRSNIIICEGTSDKDSKYRIHEIYDKLRSDNSVKEAFCTQFIAITQHMENNGVVKRINHMSVLPDAPYSETGAEFIRQNELSSTIRKRKRTADADEFHGDLIIGLNEVMCNIIKNFNFFPIDVKALASIFIVSPYRYDACDGDKRLLARVLTSSFSYRRYNFEWKNEYIQPGTPLVAIFQMYEADAQEYTMASCATFTDKTKIDRVYFDICMDCLFQNQTFRTYFGIDSRDVNNYHAFSGKDNTYPGFFIPYTFSSSSARLLFGVYLEYLNCPKFESKTGYRSLAMHEILNGSYKIDTATTGEKNSKCGYAFMKLPDFKTFFERDKVNLLRHGKSCSVSTKISLPGTIQQNSRSIQQKLTKSGTIDTHFAAIKIYSDNDYVSIRLHPCVWTPFSWLKDIIIHNTSRLDDVIDLREFITEKIIGFGDNSEKYGEYDEETGMFVRYLIPGEKEAAEYCFSVVDTKGDNKNSIAWFNEKWLEHLKRFKESKYLPNDEAFNEYFAMFKTFIDPEGAFGCDNEATRELYLHVLDAVSNDESQGSDGTIDSVSRSCAVVEAINKFDELFS